MSSVSVGPTAHARRAEAAHQALDRAPVGAAVEKRDGLDDLLLVWREAVENGLRDRRLPGLRRAEQPREEPTARRRRQHGQAGPALAIPTGLHGPPAAERADVDVLDAVRREACRVLADEQRAPADGAVDRRRGASHRWEGLAERCSSPGRAGGCDARTEGARVLNKYVGDRGRRSAAFQRDSDGTVTVSPDPPNPFRTRLPSWRPRSASGRCERELPRSARTTCGSRRDHL